MAFSAPEGQLQKANKEELVTRSKTGRINSEIKARKGQVLGWSSVNGTAQSAESRESSDAVKHSPAAVAVINNSINNARVNTHVLVSLTPVGFSSANSYFSNPYFLLPTFDENSGVSPHIPPDASEFVKVQRHNKGLPSGDWVQVRYLYIYLHIYI
jgi:hypothetical protein